MLHLDTSFLIRALQRETVEAQRLRHWLVRRRAIGVSAMTWAEFLCGPLTVGQVQDAGELLGEPAPITGFEATLAAELFNATGRRRGSMADCLIAATAINRGAELATSDRSDFERFTAFGLVLASS